MCPAISDEFHVPIVAAAVTALAAVVDAVILAFISMELSGDGELNQIFIEQRKETSNSMSLFPECTHTYGVVGRQNAREK